MKHTPTPWVMNSTKKFIENPGGLAITNLDGSVLVGSASHDLTDKSIEEYCANAERIVACVNAFDGIKDPQHYINEMKELHKKYLKENSELRSENNRLRERIVV